MKFRYERAKKEDETIEEENIIRNEYGLSNPVEIYEFLINRLFY